MKKIIHITFICSFFIFLSLHSMQEHTSHAFITSLAKEIETVHPEDLGSVEFLKR